uniref:Uncharacterized protein n=1 Tax=Triticum urartu TaxID=4572 RepID=A0A8R7QNS1_TRIUA
MGTMDELHLRAVPECVTGARPARYDVQHETTRRSTALAIPGGRRRPVHHQGEKAAAQARRKRRNNILQQRHGAGGRQAAADDPVPERVARAREGGRAGGGEGQVPRDHAPAAPRRRWAHRTRVVMWPWNAC